MLFVASASPRRSRVAYLVAALASSRACWRVVRAGRSLGPRWRTHHMRTPRATQMARSSISEQPGRSSPMCWPVRCSLATADASRKRRRSTAAALKCQGAASGGTEHWWRSFVPREGSLTAGRRARCRCVLVARRGGATLRGPRGQSTVPTEHPLRRSSSHIARRAAVERSRVTVVCIAYQNKRQPSADTTH